jgi:septum formation protein
VTLHGRIDGNERVRTFSEVSTVHVDHLTEQEIASYVDSGEPLDKAGAYGIQGAFCKHVTRIEGDYFNIVGLPVSRVYRELKAFCS